MAVGPKYVPQHYLDPLGEAQGPRRKSHPSRRVKLLPSGSKVPKSGVYMVSILGIAASFWEYTLYLATWTPGSVLFGLRDPGRPPSG